MRKKIILTTALIVSLLIPNNASAKYFDDVKVSDWFFNVVTDLSDKGIINGYQDNTFKPNRKVSYAEFLTLLNNTLGVRQAPDNKNPREWYNPTLNELKNKGVITKEISNPNGEITRNEMAKYLSLGLEKLKHETPNTTRPTAINDFDNVPKEYQKYVAHLVNAGYIKGDQHANFNGDRQLTRAETATIIKAISGNPTENKVVADSELQLTDPYKPMVWREKMVRKYVRQPQEGDVVIKADGTRVTLKNGMGGVLGAGQGVDPYTGLIMKDGSVFKEGDIGWHGWYSLFGQEGLPGGDNKMSMGGQPYSIDPKTGEGHFDYEWIEMRTVGATRPPVINENMDEIPWEKVVKPGDRPMSVTDPLTGKTYNTNGQFEWKGTYWEGIML